MNSHLVEMLLINSLLLLLLLLSSLLLSSWEGTYLLVKKALESFRSRLASTPLTLVKLSRVILQQTAY